MDKILIFCFEAKVCAKYEMSFEEAKTWYDGYQLIVHQKDRDEYHSMYSPKSVVEAYINAISTMDWYGVANLVEDSRKCYWCD